MCHQLDLRPHTGADAAAPSASSSQWTACCSTAPAQGQRHGWTTLQGADSPLMEGLAADQALILWVCVHAGGSCQLTPEDCLRLLAGGKMRQPR